jgi:Mg-chelatase subunit ChlD
MKTTSILIACALAAITTLHAKVTSPEPRPKVEVAFVLDSTGSMGGLIEGAKEKIWTIANSIIARDPKPGVRIGLVSYRDRGDDYITRMHDLTDDIDTVFSQLRQFSAGGGGDGPESVNQALHEAVTLMSWSKDKDITRIIFLVGDAPPHMDYQDDIKYPETCKLAARAGIIINTVQCGNMAETTPVWKEIAKLAEGTYIALAQTGGMIAITAPQDGEIARLSRELGDTSVAYGDARQRAEVFSKNAAAAAAAPAVAAERAKYNWNSGGRAVQGAGDLLTDLAEGKVELAAIQQDELPDELKKLNGQERKEFIDKQQARRTGLNTQLGKLVAERHAFICAEQEKLAKEGKGDSFDLKVAEIISGQVK